MSVRVIGSVNVAIIMGVLQFDSTAAMTVFLVEVRSLTGIGPGH